MGIRGAQRRSYGMTSDSFKLDRASMLSAFARAAGTYDEAAVLQGEVRGRLLERLDLVKLKPAVVLDAGAGTGAGSVRLLRRYRAARVIALDIAQPMARRARRRKPWFGKMDVVCADAERLPLADASVELVFSNLMLQWCDDPAVAFAEFRRVLAPDGLLMFSSFGPDTLKELRAAWSAADEKHVHVNRFIDMHDLGDALLRTGFADPVMDVEHLTLTYDDVYRLMRDLKAIGAHNVNAGRPHGLTGPRRLNRMREAYERYRRDGRLPATWEVVYGHAWAPPPGMARRTPGAPGEARIPAAAIGRLKKDKR